MDCINEDRVINIEEPESNHSKKTKLILDVKTRWSSLADMLETFIELLPSVKKALLKLNSDFEFTSCNAKAITEILEAIKPFREAVTHLSESKANQFDVVGVINYLKKELNKSDTILAKNLLKSLEERVERRCSRKLIQLSLFFQNPKSLNLIGEEKEEFFPIYCIFI